MVPGGMTVTLVGTSGGIAGDAHSLKRGGPAVVVDVGDASLLFDAGRNALIGLHRHGINPSKLTHLVFTHYHSDHTIGLPDLILSTWVASGRDRWQVLGPVGAKTLFERLFGVAGAFRPDIEARAFGGTSRLLFMQRHGRPLTTPQFSIFEIEQEGDVAGGADWRLEASFAPDHVQPALISVAFRITTPMASVVITGDTGPNDAVAAFAKDADLLIHDCTLLERHGVYERQQVHTDAESLGRVAAKAGVKAVIGTHVTRSIDDPAVLAHFASRVARHFAGPFTMAEDGLCITLGAGPVCFRPDMSQRVRAGRGN